MRLGKCVMITLACFGFLKPGIGLAIIIPPGAPPEWLDHWSFSNTNTWVSDLAYAPVSFTNLDSSLLGHGSAVVVDSTNAAWLHYNVTENDGTNHLTVDRGSVVFWFAPNWAGTNEGGTGPGQWGRLIDVGSYTTNVSYGWWSLYVDPEGMNVYFSAQTNGSDATYLSAPIDWTTNRWHQLALAYSATNSALYLDGVLATNGPGVTLWPGSEVLTNGFYIGSDSNGLAQARGMYDDLATYDHPLTASKVNKTFQSTSFYYWVNPLNPGNYNIASAPSSPSTTPTFNAVTGSGFLTALSTNSLNCVSNSNIWITNVVAAMASNGTTMNLTFTIAGGQDGILYDVFANSVLDFSATTNFAWAWMGQGYQCVNYRLTNLPSSGAVFVILGTPQDSDHDGLTDAYERLVSKTDPKNPDTDGDGMPDGWEVAFGLNPLLNDAAGDADGDGLTNYQEYLGQTDPQVRDNYWVFLAAPKPGSNLP